MSVFDGLLQVAPIYRRIEATIHLACIMGLGYKEFLTLKYTLLGPWVVVRRGWPDEVGN